MLLVTDFRDRHEAVISETAWGSVLSRKPGGSPPTRAAWIFVDQLPVLEPWRAPRSWGELTEALAKAGVDLPAVVTTLAPKLRGKEQPLLLLGTPIPPTVGHSPNAIHWLAIRLPPLSTGNKTAPGFRPNEQGYRRRDRAVLFAPHRSVDWLATRNWAEEEIATRGRASGRLRGSKLVLIGAGALGSALAELLVREGVFDVTVIDPDVFTVGNLVRHNLTLADVGKSKARGLAERLNAASPHARVQAISEAFPGGDNGRAALQSADVIVDTTGDDALIVQLASDTYTSPKLFVSAAVGLFARRFFFFAARALTFPGNAFARHINPWLLYERAETSGSPMRWEGTGCWHPVFPARASDFAVYAGLALREIERAASAHEVLTFRVLEQHVDNLGSTGIRVLIRPPGDDAAG